MNNVLNDDPRALNVYYLDHNRDYGILERTFRRQALQ